jgi:hypothetical protein
MIGSGTHMCASKFRRILGTLILLASFGAGGCASVGPGPNAITATQLSPADEQLVGTVQAALHADPYLYDKHIEVSIEHGNVALRGFVMNDWDLINAKKIAFKAAGGIRVIDYLTINPIEERNAGPRR